MRIGVLSDTHIPDKSHHLPQAMLDEFKKVDMIVHAGDLGDLSVLEKLKNVCPNVRAVWGNMDPCQVQQKLPEKEVFTAGKFKIGLMHGRGAPDRLPELLGEAFQNDKVDIIIFGHSHYGVNEKRSGILFFNPGSPTDKIFAAYNSFGIIEIGDKIDAKIIKI